MYPIFPNTQFPVGEIHGEFVPCGESVGEKSNFFTVGITASYMTLVLFEMTTVQNWIVSALSRQGGSITFMESGTARLLVSTLKEVTESLREKTQRIVAEMGVAAEIYIETYRDIESPELSEEIIKVKVKGMSYKEALHLWDTLIDKVFQDEDPELTENVRLVVDPLEE